MIELPNDILIRQKAEPLELIGASTNNHYQALTKDQNILLTAVEVEKPAWEGDTIIRQTTTSGWTKNPLVYRDANQTPFLRATHPFRWLLDRVELRTTENKLVGAIQARFLPFYRAFDIENENGKIIASASTAFFGRWLYTFQKGGRDIALLKKDWKGVMQEALSSQDAFDLKILNPALNANEKLLIVASAIYVDLKYFNRPFVRLNQ